MIYIYTHRVTINSNNYYGILPMLNCRQTCWTIVTGKPNNRLSSQPGVGLRSRRWKCPMYLKPKPPAEPSELTGKRQRFTCTWLKSLGDVLVEIWAKLPWTNGSDGSDGSLNSMNADHDMSKQCKDNCIDLWRYIEQVQHSASETLKRPTGTAAEPVWGTLKKRKHLWIDC